MKIALLLGGPSMKDVDFSRVKADAFVGVNWAFMVRTSSAPRINVVCDYRCMDRILSDYDPNKDGVPAVTHFRNWVADGGESFFVDHAAQHPRYAHTQTLKSTYPKWPVYPSLIVNGLYCRNNVGLTGLNLACMLMPNRGEIDIYGLDLNSKPKSHEKTKNWHEHHDPRWAADAAAAYPGMLKHWEEAAKLVPFGIRVRNMNPDSAFRGFEFA